MGAVGVVLNSQAYFIGGRNYTTNVYVNTMNIFNPKTNTSTAGALLNHARAYHAATVVNSTILVCGGWSDNSLLLDSCEQYSPTTSTWIVFASLPVSNYLFSMTTVNNNVYIFGGADGSGTCTGNSDAVLMLAGGVWQNVTKMPYPSREHASIAINSTHALVCGGMQSGNMGCSVGMYCDTFSTITNKFKIDGFMTTQRYDHSIAMLNGEGFC
jgi:N-acetylneuraminic acid mutarotase